MIWEDVTDGCASKRHVLTPCEICATSFRLTFHALRLTFHGS